MRGVQGLRFKREGDLEYWFKPLQGGDWAFCILNRGSEDCTVSIDWTDFCFTDSISGMSTGFDKLTYSAVDLWDRNAPVIKTDNNLQLTVNTHDVKIFRLSPCQ